MFHSIYSNAYIQFIVMPTFNLYFIIIFMSNIKELPTLMCHNYKIVL